MDSYRRALRLFANEFIDTGYLIALSAVGVVYLTSVISRGPLHLSTIALVFFLTLSIYSADRALSSHEGRVGKLRRIRRVRLLTAVFSVAISLLLPILYGKPTLLCVVLAFLVLGLLYGICFKSISSKIPGFKSLFVGLMWAFLLLAYCTAESVILTNGVFLFGAWVFLQAVVNTSICDIKDIEEDITDGIRTLAVMLGSKKLCFFMHFINLLSLAVSVYMLSVTNQLHYAVWFSLTAVYTFVYIHIASQYGGGCGWIFNIYADSIYTASAILVIIGSWYVRG